MDAGLMTRHNRGKRNVIWRMKSLNIEIINKKKLYEGEK